MTRPFLFDTHFPADLMPEGIDPPALEPVLGGFTEADLEAVRDRAFKQGLEVGERDGFERGVQNARQSAEAQAAQTLAAVETALKSVAGSLHGFQAELEHDAVKVVTALVTRLAPPLLDAVAEAELDTLVRETLEAAIGRPCLRLRVAPSALERLSRDLAKVQETAGFSGVVDLAADPSLPPGTARADWGAGGAARDPRTIERQVADAVAIAVSRLTVRARDSH